MGRKSGSYEWHEIQDTVDYYEYFDKPKIVYNRFMLSPLFWLDSSEFYINNALNVVPNASFYEVGLFNSNPSWFFLESIASTMSGGFYQIHGHVLEKLPIPKATASQKEVIATLAEDCQTLAESRYKMQDAFRRRIPDLCPPDKEAKLSNKLKAWWELDFSEFQKEIKSRFKHPMTFDEKEEWEAPFEDRKQKIQQYNYQLASKEAELNAAVYELFGLDADEITLLEQKFEVMPLATPECRGWSGSPSRNRTHNCPLGGGRYIRLTMRPLGHILTHHASFTSVLTDKCHVFGRVTPRCP